MGNENPVASSPGSFIPSRTFYDYEDKYVLGKTQFMIPADLPPEQMDNLKRSALTAYRSLHCNGFARVDFFIEEGTKRIVINEINTIPGFTEISMFPKLWEVEHISFRELVTKLIELGFEHSNKLFSRINSPG
jgi:D-alanine-D-alanine ligase